MPHSIRMIFLIFIWIKDGLSDGSGTELKKCDCSCDYEKYAVKIAISLCRLGLRMIFWMQVLELV